MLKGIFKKIIGDPNQREIDSLWPIVDEIVLLEAEFERMSDEALSGLTDEFKQHLHMETAALRSRLERSHRDLSLEVAPGRRERLKAEVQRLQEDLDETQEEVLTEILPRAFAAVMEASKRTIGERHFREQLLGGIVIHRGEVAEMKTGEGKTLVSTLPLYLNALTGRGVHLVTVNDYLARRDAVWMGPIYHLLGLSVAVLLEGGSKAALYVPGYTKGEFTDLRSVGRGEAYAADVTYGTNHQFGFDYLRDNLVLDPSMVVQRELNYAVVDEVDNIFIDEARTPLIISGPSSEPLEEYKRFASAVGKLSPGIDYEVGEKERSVSLTEQGLDHLERETGILDIYDEANFRYVHFMQQALNARALYRRDRDYIVRGRRVVLVDHFTGRLMPDRKLSDGLHQAIEAKEGVPITPRNVIHATITIQNYFRMYRKLAGMTGTAASEAEEFDKIYGLAVVVIPTHEPMIREDLPDVIYKNESAKWQAIISEIEECHRRGRPVLAGTTSVEKSEQLSQRLARTRIEHHVLNAKRHAEEAGIIARAGEPGAVTIATNMAGRGVDIKLGGELLERTMEAAQRVLRQRGIDPFKAGPEQVGSAIAEVVPEFAQRRERVLEAGGLHIIGTERHEARRIDDQLRGRAGRQGEPGSSRFFLSLEDDLMRRFGGSRIANLMDRVGLEEEIPIEHGLVDRAIGSTQARVEGYNFDIRKHLLDYDDVLDAQRKATYSMRQRILAGESVSADLHAMIEEQLVEQFSRLDAGEVSVWEVLSHLDSLTFAISPRDSVYRHSHVLVGHASCFPPLSLSLLADGLMGLSLAELRGDILRRTESALKQYLDYLLDDVIGRGLDEMTGGEAEERWEERLQDLRSSLLNQLEAFIAQAPSQQGSVSYRRMLEKLQSSFPIQLHLKASDLQGLDIEGARDELMRALERSYASIKYQRLVGWVWRRMPAEIQLGKAQLSDLDLSHWETFVAHALSRTRTEADRDQVEKLDRAARQSKQDSKGTGLLARITEAGQWAEIEVAELECLLRQIVAARFDIWAAQVRVGVEEVLERCFGQGAEERSRDDAVQLLLNVFYVVRKMRDHSGRTLQRPAPRLPLHFLLAEDVENAEPSELREQILEHLFLALDSREATWAGQEMTLLAKQRLSSLESHERGALVHYLGNQQIHEYEDVPIGQLEERVRNDLLFSLRVQAWGQVRIPQLGDSEYESVGAYLEQKLAAVVAALPVADLDEPIRQIAETHLRDRGYFDDRDLEARYMQRRVSDLDAGVRAGIAQFLGQRFMEAHLDTPFGELGAEERESIRRLFEARRYFVNEERVQRFFVSECLNDLAEEIARRTTEYLAREQLKGSRRRRLADLDERTRQRVTEFLLQSGRFLHERRDQLFPETGLRDLESSTREELLVRLGEARIQLEAPMSQQPEDVRQQALKHLRSVGFFRDENREKRVLGQRLPELGPEVLGVVQDRALASLQEQLVPKTMAELPGAVSERIYDYLCEADYFIDQGLAKRLERQPLISLDVQTLHNLEEKLGQAIIRPLGDVPFREVDRRVREDILRFMDQNGLLRKKSRRKEFLRGSLSKTSKEVYDAIAHHLGRSKLTPVRRMPLRDVPSTLRQQIWHHLRSTRYALDEEKVRAFDDQRLQDFGPALAGQVKEHLSEWLGDQLRHKPIGDLPDYLQSYAMEHVTEVGLLLDENRVSAFQELVPGSLDMEPRRSLSTELGMGLLRGEGDVVFGQLSLPLQRRVRSILEGMRYFTDEEALNKFMQARVEELDDDTLEAMTRYLGHGLTQDVAGQPMASLSEAQRRTIRTYLDQVGAFVDGDRLEEFQRETFRDLSRGDTDEIARSLGETQLSHYAQERLMDLGPTQRDFVSVYLRGQEMFLDKSKLGRFRSGTINDLEGEARAAVLARIWGEWGKELSERTLAALSPALGSYIREYLRSDTLPIPGIDVGDLKSICISELDPEQYGQLAVYMGEQHMERIEITPVESLAREDRAVLRDYLGRRMMEDVEKSVLLTTTSALWIDYLTAIEDLRQGIGLQAYAQRDPLVEYKRRAYEMYQELQANIRRMVVSRIFRHAPRRPRLTRADVGEEKSASDSRGASEEKVLSSKKRKRKRRSRKRKSS